MGRKKAPDDDGPAVPMSVGADDDGNGGVPVHGLFDAGDGRVLIWMASDLDGGVVCQEPDGTVIPFIVFWTWDTDEPDGSPGGAWNYRSVVQARRRFVRELTEAVVRG